MRISSARAGLEALIDDVRTEHAQITPSGRRKCGRDGPPDITRQKCVRGVGLVGRRRVGEDELRTAPASAE